MRSIFFLILSLHFAAVKAQYLNRSLGNYSSELQLKELSAKSYRTRISFYRNGNLLELEDNLATLKYTGQKDSVPLSEKIISLKFQSNLPSDLQQMFKGNKYSNLIRVEGTLTIGGVSKECVAFIAPLVINASSNEVLLDLTMKFDLSEYNIDDALIKFKGLTELDVEDGYVYQVE